MKLVGFFSELPHGMPDGPSLAAAVGQLDEDTARHLAEYLDAGTVIVPTLGSRAFDVLSEERTDIGRLAICSDGEWAWPSDLGFYVAKYRVGLPTEFIDHARRHDWQPRGLSPEEIAAAADDLVGQD
jgi:hypothetical protein